MSEKRIVEIDGKSVVLPGAWGSPILEEIRGPKELTGKRDWSVFPFREAGAVCDVFEYGAKKYGKPFTYRAGIPTGELLAAIIRHSICIQEGQMIDKESGLPHAGHIAANALMMLSGQNEPS